MTVCVDCGAVRFSLPERERRVLATGAPVEWAVVSDVAVGSDSCSATDIPITVDISNAKD